MKKNLSFKYDTSRALLEVTYSDGLLGTTTIPILASKFFYKQKGDNEIYFLSTVVRVVEKVRHKQLDGMLYEDIKTTLERIVSNDSGEYIQANWELLQLAATKSLNNVSITMQTADKKLISVFEIELELLRENIVESTNEIIDVLNEFCLQNVPIIKMRSI